MAAGYNYTEAKEGLDKVCPEKKPFHFVHSTVNSVDVEIKVVMVSVYDLHSRRKHSNWEHQ